VCAKLSAGEAGVFNLLLAAVALQRRASGETSRLTPSGLIRTLVIREANRLGITSSAPETTPEVQ